MKRLIAIGLSVLMLVSFSADAAYELSDSAKAGYLDWIKKSGSSWSYALAVSPNGGYASWASRTIYGAKREALRECKEVTKSTSCKIMDVDGKSAFIKKRGSSSYSSTALSFVYSYSDKIWCVEKHDYKYMPYGRCVARSGKVFPSQHQAKAEYERTTGSSYSTASSSNSKLVWCARITGVTYENRSNCTTSGGDWFVSQGSAETEHDRLKRSSSTVSSFSVEENDDDWIWCATKNRASWRQRYSCIKALKGQAFPSKHLAEAEHKRLKAASSTASSSSSTTSKNIYECLHTLASDLN